MISGARELAAASKNNIATSGSVEISIQPPKKRRMAIEKGKPENDLGPKFVQQKRPMKSETNGRMSNSQNGLHDRPKIIQAAQPDHMNGQNNTNQIPMQGSGDQGAHSKPDSIPGMSAMLNQQFQLAKIVKEFGSYVASDKFKNSHQSQNAGFGQPMKRKRDDNQRKSWSAAPSYSGASEWGKQPSHMKSHQNMQNYDQRQGARQIYAKYNGHVANGDTGAPPLRFKQDPVQNNQTFSKYDQQMAVANGRSRAIMPYNIDDGESTTDRKAAKFILRLAQMVNEKQSNHLCVWAEDGKSFFASDCDEFCNLRSVIR